MPAADTTVDDLVAVLAVDDLAVELVAALAGDDCEAWTPMVVHWWLSGTISRREYYVYLAHICSRAGAALAGGAEGWLDEYHQ